MAIDLNNNKYDLNKAMRDILTNYPDEFETVGRLRDTADHLNYLYSLHGEDAINDWFLTTDKKFIKMCKALVIKEL